MTPEQFAAFVDAIKNLGIGAFMALALVYIVVKFINFLQDTQKNNAQIQQQLASLFATQQSVVADSAVRMTALSASDAKVTEALAQIQSNSHSQAKLIGQVVDGFTGTTRDLSDAFLAGNATLAKHVTASAAAMISELKVALPTAAADAIIEKSANLFHRAYDDHREIRTLITDLAAASSDHSASMTQTLTMMSSKCDIMIAAINELKSEIQQAIPKPVADAADLAVYLEKKLSDTDRLNAALAVVPPAAPTEPPAA
jgi:hypothetical protein